MIDEILLRFQNGQSLSDEFINNTGYEKLIGMMFATGANTTSYSFQAYDADGNAYSVVDLTGTEVVITVSQTVARFYPVNPHVFAGVAKLKVRRGTQASPFTTGAEDTIIKALRRAY